jgi:hypothetical protein
MYRRIGVTIIAFCIFVPLAARAATLSVRGTDVLAPSGEGVLDVVLDTEDADINSIEGSLFFTGDSVRVQDVEDGGSPVLFWLIPPTLSTDGVRFSGVIPGGIRGSDIVLFRVITEGVYDGVSTISFTDTRVLLNDGGGTPVGVSPVPHSIVVSADTPRTVYDAGDTISPGAFTVTLTQSPALGGKWVAVFVANDKETGVAYYEAQESLWGRVDETAWTRATSPYELHDQWRIRRLFIKAVDRSGNSTIAAVSPGQNRMLGMFGYGILLLVVLLLVYAFVRRMMYRGRHKNIVS